MTEDLRAFSERRAGRSPRQRREELPAQLRVPLHRWLARFLDARLEQRVALRMELGSPWPSSPVLGQLGELMSNEQLLDAVDYALQLDRDLARELHRDRTFPGGDPEYSPHWSLVDELTDLFDDALSTLQVIAGENSFLLAHRVDPTAQTSFDHAVDSADDTTGTRLRAAWRAAYGREPEPDTAYRDAVRAVERAIAPVVSSTNPQPTLSTALRTLERDPAFELALVDDHGYGGVEPFLVMLRRLWHGQRSRHGGGPHSRDQTLEEARAAVQLAALCVQWLTDGVLRRRSPPSAP